MKLHAPSRPLLLAAILMTAACRAPAQGYQPTLLVFPPFGHSYGWHKAGRMSLKLFLSLGADFDDPQGVACTKLSAGDDPGTEDDDDELTVYAVNANRNQVIYNRGLSGLAAYGSLGSGDGQFHTPRGIAATADGLVYVADMNNHRVVCLLNENGRLSFARNVGAGDLRYPRQCAVDARGNLYVTDTGHDRVMFYDQAGRQINNFGGNGLFDEPDGIAVVDFTDKWLFRHETVIIVVDSLCGRIRKFDQFGRQLAAINGGDIGLPGAYFGYVALDYYGSCYATDRVNFMVHKFDRDLKYVAGFGRKGGGDREFDSPRGIAIWKRYGQVFILERESAQYYWIGIDGFIRGLYPDTMDRDHPGVTISLQLYEPADFNIQIADSSGKAVRNLVPEFREKLGENLIVWDGCDDSGRPVPVGQYDITITMEPTYSAKGYFKKELKATVRKVE